MTKGRQLRISSLIAPAIAARIEAWTAHGLRRSWARTRSTSPRHRGLRGRLWTAAALKPIFGKRPIETPDPSDLIPGPEEHAK